MGWEKGAKEPWLIVSDEPTDAETLYEYGRRFTIEEGFLDDKSNGFQWESSKLRQAEVLQRLCFVMAVATLVAGLPGGRGRRCRQPAAGRSALVSRAQLRPHRLEMDPARRRPGRGAHRPLGPAHRPRPGAGLRLPSPS